VNTDLPSGYRAQVAARVEATIAEHYCDDFGRCVVCGVRYPCGPRRMAEQAADGLARKLATPAPGGVGDPSKEPE
jgi:hypothetical protein